uniref:Uncharacterized protein n=1 Tax=Cacopsylla melanoneura TaxID=428564 RepID=A0A8D8RH95_9HEMI
MFPHILYPWICCGQAQVSFLGSREGCVIPLISSEQRLKWTDGQMQVGLPTFRYQIALDMGQLGHGRSPKYRGQGGGLEHRALFVGTRQPPTPLSFAKLASTLVPPCSNSGG